MKKYSHLQKFIFAIIVLSIFACSKDSTKKIKQEAKFIGKETCKSCHEEEYNSWVGSDHDKAMAVATDSSVLGNFNKSEFKFEGVTSKFYKKGNKFFVRTNGPHGKIGEFEITHTFGYKPLQQYLIPFENGRYQCLPIAWDTEKEKWFSLAEAIYSDDIPKPNDWLYWTNNAQNWNGMCAECHSTNLQKNFDPKTKIFNTTYSEINVSCEACHGPGSNHKEWAESPKMIRTTDSNFDLIVKTSNISSKKYVELCTYCHSRRASLSHLDYKSKHSLDMIIPGALDENYFPDGQILEEDYVYASFAHSKMYENDVSCRNCHNVHSGKLILEGNTLCAQCHVPNVYDTPKHHFHKLQLEKGKPLILKDKIYQVGEGAKCINCHMPGRYYMGNDFRRDHSFRVPRPGLSITLGTPNACNQCHTNQSNQWAEKYITKWYGSVRKPHFGTIFAKCRSGNTEALNDVIRIVKDTSYATMVRATAVSLLPNYNSLEAFESLKQTLKNNEPLIRYYAAHSIDNSYVQMLMNDLLPLLSDSIKAIRLDVAVKLSGLPKTMIPIGKHKLLDETIQEYIEAMNYSADFAGSRLNLGIIYSNTQNFEEAARQYSEALKIDSLFYPAKVNLSVVLNRLNRNDEAEEILHNLIKNHPDFYDSYYSLGLLLAEKKDYKGAIKHLTKATKHFPNRARIFYNLGLIFQVEKKFTKAEKAIKNAIKIEPKNLDYFYVLADMYLKSNQDKKAKAIAKEIENIFPPSSLRDAILNKIKN